MRIFISMAGRDRDTAECLALSLRAEGHVVFVDSSGLAAGHAYNRPIRSEIEAADLFIFLLSTDAVATGSYPRAELAFVEHKWPNPDGRVLVVEMEPVTPQATPPYLRHLTHLRPKGNQIAEISSRVAELARQRRQRLGRRLLLVAPVLAIGVGTSLLSGTAQLVLSNVVVTGLLPDAGGLPVDVGELEVRWSYVGEPEDLIVCFQQIDTGQRTADKRVPAAAGRLIFLPRDLQPILRQRERGQSNRVRALLQSSRGFFISDTCELRVGIRLMTVKFPEKVKVAALIDNRIIDFYDFDAIIFAPHKKDASKGFRFEGAVKYGGNDFMMPNIDDFDWSQVKVVYLGPDDPRIVTCEVLVDSEPQMNRSSSSVAIRDLTWSKSFVSGPHGESQPWSAPLPLQRIATVNPAEYLKVELAQSTPNSARLRIAMSTDKTTTERQFLPLEVVSDGAFAPIVRGDPTSPEYVLSHGSIVRTPSSPADADQRLLELWVALDHGMSSNADWHPEVKNQRYLSGPKAQSIDATIRRWQ